jgi:hypothetical protein
VRTRKAVLAFIPFVAVGIFIHGAIALKSLILTNRSPVSKGVAALPRIANPSAIQARINGDLARQDRRVKQQAAACREPQMHWERKVEVNMQGPAVLSFLIHDSADCGGVHPFDETFPLVYDLRTGKGVRWDTVFQDAGGQKVDVSLSDGTPMTALKSERLRAAYLSAYGDNGCKETVTFYDNGFLFYPDAKTHALEMIPASLPQVAHVCIIPVPLGDAELISLGVSEAWRKALLPGSR